MGYITVRKREEGKNKNGWKSRKYQVHPERTEIFSKEKNNKSNVISLGKNKWEISGCVDQYKRDTNSWKIL